MQSKNNCGMLPLPYRIVSPLRHKLTLLGFELPVDGIRTDAACGHFCIVEHHASRRGGWCGGRASHGSLSPCSDRLSPDAGLASVATRQAAFATYSREVALSRVIKVRPHRRNVLRGRKIGQKIAQLSDGSDLGELALYSRFAFARFLGISLGAS